MTLKEELDHLMARRIAKKVAGVKGFNPPGPPTKPGQYQVSYESAEAGALEAIKQVDEINADEMKFLQDRIDEFEAESDKLYD